MHTHYKGTGRVHSFRGLLVHGAQDEISIQGSVGAIAWRMTKLSLIAGAPGAGAQLSTVQVWREKQSSIVGTVNFSDNELLAVGLYHQQTGVYGIHTIFDNQIFTRNIYVTHNESSTGQSINYYFELEEVTVSAAGKGQLAVAAARRTLHS